MVKTKPDQSVAVSADGLNWEIVGTFPRIGDECIVVDYDRENSVYIMFTRYLYRRPSYNVSGPSPRNVIPQLRTHRIMGMALSKDMLNWSYAKTILTPDRDDSLDAEFEFFSPLCYEGIYVGVLGVNRRTGPYVDASDSQLVYSRDGLNWQRMSERKSFMSPGENGSWDEINAQDFSLVVHDDKIFIFYDGHCAKSHHLCQAIGLATLRLDGFVSLDAPDPVLNTGVGMTGSHDSTMPVESTLLTRPLWLTGNRLVVNATAGGFINAELTDPDGHVLNGFGYADCDDFTGDELRHTFRWHGRKDIGGLFLLRIRFRMIDARLYSLQIEEVS